MVFCDSKSCFGFKISQYHHSRTSCREVNGVFSARKCSFMVVAEPPAALWWQAVSRQHPPWYASLPSSAELNSFPCRRSRWCSQGTEPTAWIYLHVWELLISALYVCNSLQIVHGELRKQKLQQSSTQQVVWKREGQPQQSSEIRCLCCHPHLLSLLVCLPSSPATFLVHLGSFWVQGTTWWCSFSLSHYYTLPLFCLPHRHSFCYHPQRSPSSRYVGIPHL